MFIRLRKELDVYKEGELELLREALRSEIHFLKSVGLCAVNIDLLLHNQTHMTNSNYLFFFYYQKLDSRQNNPH